MADENPQDEAAPTGGSIRTSSARDAVQAEAGFGAQYAQAALPKNELKLPVPPPDRGCGNWRSRWPALRHLLTASGTFAAMAMVTYAIPGLDELRPWMPGRTGAYGEAAVPADGRRAGDGGERRRGGRPDDARPGAGGGRGVPGG